MGVIVRANEALNINPPAGDEYLSVNGSNWLWAVTAIYTVSLIAVFCHSFMARAGEKIFHYMFTIALLVGAISYFAQASDLGWSLVATEDNTLRQIFFAKYINWVVSFPVMAVAMGLLSGVPWATIIYNVFLAWTWQISYLCCVYTTTSYKWGFFGFGCLAGALLLFSIAYDGGKAAKRVGVSRDFGILYGCLQLTWNLYMSGVGVTDAGNTIGVTSTFIWFGVLDLIMGPLFAFTFLYMSRSWDYNKLNIAFTQYGRVQHGGVFPEKQTAPAGGVVERAV
jgi:bacteriorhodopsin